MGNFLQAIYAISFGFLSCIDDVDVFLGTADLLRIISGMADSASYGAALAILIDVIPTKVSKITAWTELLFQAGFVIGKKYM